MKKNIEKKQKIIKEINSLSNDSISTIIIDYSYIKSIDIKNIRKLLLENNFTVKVLKNTLAKKAIKETKNESLYNNLKGQTLIIFSKNEPILPIKILNNLKLEYEALKIKAICIEGKVFFERDVSELITIPNKNTAIIKLIKLINLPLINTLNILKTTYTNLYLMLFNLKIKGEK